MGLKSDIYDALEKNIGKEHIKNSPEGKAKVDTLAKDLSAAIQTFILAQDFKIDKLSAPVFIPIVEASNILPIPAPPGAVVPVTPIMLQGKGPGVPFIESTADADINGQAANGSLLGKSASDNSLVKLRSVKEKSK